MFARLEELEVTIQDFKDVKYAVEKSNSIEDIGEIFRIVFASYSSNAFTSESSQAYENLKNILERIAAKPQISAKDLHDFKEFYSRLYSYDVVDAIKIDFPEYAILFEKAEKLSSLELKNEVIKEGANFMQEKFASIMEDIKIFREEFEFVRQGKEELYGDKFGEAKYFIKGKIAEKIEKEFPGGGDFSNCLINSYAIDMNQYSEKRYKLLKRYIELRQQVAEECKDKFKEYAELVKDVERRNERAKMLKEKIFENVSNSLKDMSEISQEEAEEWASNNVYLEKGIERKLNSIGYPKNKLFQDIADLYRICGGKLGPVEFIMTRKSRAFAYSEKMQIAVSKFFDKRTLFHECGHLVEKLDNLSLKCSCQFIEDRATGAKQTLRSLTGNKGYEADEMAYPDNFISPYVGKVYQWPASEVFSMAIEKMASPDKMIEFMEKDPEHFKLFLGVCLHKNQELTQRIKKISDTAAVIHKKNSEREKNEKYWKNIILKAMKNIEEPLEKLLTAPAPYEGLELQIRGKQCHLLWNIDDITKGYVYSGNKKDSLAAAYFTLLSKRNLIPLDFRPNDASFRRIITGYVDGATPPSWYEPETGLPILDLGDKGTAITNLYKAWMEELNKRTPPNLLELLAREDGFCDYFINRIPNSANKKIYLYHKEATWKWLAKERASLIVYIAYLLIAFDKGLLADYKASYRSIAASDFENYLSKKIVPDWFDPQKGLPELSL